MAILILIGVGRSSLCGAVMALILNFAPNPFSLSDLINWTLGSVANRSLADVATTAPLILIGCALLASERANLRSEEHTSELQSLMRISYAVFCLKKKITTRKHTHTQESSVTSS